jgi:hypothetical protein
MNAETMTRRAELSECGRYRYTLERAWAQLPRYVLWLMLNPSTADAAKDDATIRRCIGYARAWGYTGILVGNLYAWRSTSPRGLLYAGAAGSDPIGPENDRHVRGLVTRAELVVCAWGQTGPLTEARQRVLQILRPRRHGGDCPHEPHALKFNANGEPAHPLRLAAKLQPAHWPIWDKLADLGPGHGG